MRYVYILTIFMLGQALLGCSEDVDDELQIRARVESMVAATEAKEMSAILEPVDKAFLGNKRIRKANLKGIALWHFKRNNNVHVVLNGLEVLLEGDEPETAKVTCNLALVGRNQTLPENAKVLAIESLWKKEGGEWFVVSATWRDPIMDFVR